MLYNFILLGLLNAYAITSGFKDAILWSRKGADAFTWNEHVVFTVERLLVVAIAVVGTQIDTIQATGDIAGFFLMFSLAHNQAYYYGRHLTDGTPFVWNYSSTSTTAKLDFSYTQRLLLFLAGLGLFVSLLLWSPGDTK